MSQRARDIAGIIYKRSLQITAVLGLMVICTGAGKQIGENLAPDKADALAGRVDKIEKCAVTKERVDGLEKRIDDDKEFRAELLRLSHETNTTVKDLVRLVGRIEGRLDEHMRR